MKLVLSTSGPRLKQTPHFDATSIRVHTSAE